MSANTDPPSHNLVLTRVLAMKAKKKAPGPSRSATGVPASTVSKVTFNRIKPRFVREQQIYIINCEILGLLTAIAATAG